jgi:hypothetical protein
MGRSLLAAAVGLLALWGCSSGDSGGGGGVTPEDGGADGALVDDSGAGGEAGDAADGGPRPDGGPSFCASLSPKPAFCDDFDDGDLTNDWDQATVVAPTSEIALDTSTFVSGSASFDAVVHAVGGGEGGYASLRSTVKGTPSHVALSFQARPSTSTIAEGAIAIGDLDVSDAHVFTLYLRDDDPAGAKASVKEIDGSTVTYHPIARLPAANAWTKITLDVDVANGRLSLLYDTEKVLDAVDVSKTPALDPTFRVGAVYVLGPEAPFELHVDDVVVTF